MIQSVAKSKIEDFRLQDFGIDGAEFTNNSESGSYAPSAGVSNISHVSHVSYIPDLQINYQNAKPVFAEAELEWFSDLLDRAASFGYKEV